MSEPTADQQPGGGRFVVVTQDGMGVTPAGSGEDADGTVERNPAELVEQPAKVMRIGSMIKQLLEEVRSAPLDEAGRARLTQIHEKSLIELEQGLAPELVAELRRITPPYQIFDAGSTSRSMPERSGCSSTKRGGIKPGGLITCTVMRCSTEP